MSTEEGKRGRVCQECGRVIPRGRRDKRFCSETCKNRWHYREEGWLKGLKTKIVRTLDRNRAILDKLLQEGVTSIEIPDLAQMGYNFDCVTSYHKVRNHDEYRCYDIKYYMSGSRVFRIMRHLFPPQPSVSSDP